MNDSVLKFSTIKSNLDFERLAIQTFIYQHKHNKIYRSYCDLINANPSDITSVKQIPFLPISFFKSHEVKSFYGTSQLIFNSSGTTNLQTSKHFLRNAKVYEQSFTKAFNLFYGSPKKLAILALLPSYLEREDSSLVYMINHLIKESAHIKSGFYLHDFKSLKQSIDELEKAKQPTLLLGVSFALLDLIEQFNFNLQYTTVMETGGMKGRRKELIREDLHQQLSKGFGVENIHSEYGMTELLSQAYSKANGIFNCPPWMRVYTQDTSDPFTRTKIGAIGSINIIDLANQDSCAFIATQDLGRMHSENQFEILGRIDYSDIRGCNLLVY